MVQPDHIIRTKTLFGRCDTLAAIDFIISVYQVTPLLKVLPVVG